MAAEVTCVSTPWTVIPMVVTDVQDFIAAGQFRGGEQLIDAQQVTRPGTLLVFLEPLYGVGLRSYAGQQLHRQRLLEQPRHDRAKETGAMRRVAFMPWMRLDCHALILRLQALVLPFKTLVFSGH